MRYISRSGFIDQPPRGPIQTFPNRSPRTGRHCRLNRKQTIASGKHISGGSRLINSPSPFPPLQSPYPCFFSVCLYLSFSRPNSWRCVSRKPPRGRSYPLPPRCNAEANSPSAETGRAETGCRRRRRRRRRHVT